MNSLEKTILDAAVKANEQYLALSGGYGIYHASESVLHVLIALAIAKKGNAVYVDAALAKVRQAMAPNVGRIPNNIRTRSDITVWNKSTNTVRAAIEIKRAWNINPVEKDAAKLRGHLKHKVSAKVGYILVYSDHTGDNRMTILDERFNRWAQDLGIILVDTRMFDDEEYEACWGFVLYRLNS